MTDESRATFTLRASRELLDRLKAAADEHSHSMNAEIVQRLEESLRKASLGARLIAEAAQGSLETEATIKEQLMLHLWRGMDETMQQSVLTLIEAAAKGAQS